MFSRCTCIDLNLVILLGSRRPQSTCLPATRCWELGREGRGLYGTAHVLHTVDLPRKSRSHAYHHAHEPHRHDRHVEQDSALRELAPVDSEVTEGG